jgi:hypothetical protein
MPSQEKASSIVPLSITYLASTIQNQLTRRIDYTFANALRDIDKREDILITVWQGQSYGLDSSSTFQLVELQSSHREVVLRVSLFNEASA